MTNEQLIKRLIQARSRVTDGTKAAILLDAILIELGSDAPITVLRGGGNGNGPPTGP